MKTEPNIEWVIVRTYQTTDYVNLTEALAWNVQVQWMADGYFKGMTMPSIPNEKWTCVYAHDWDSFLRFASWKLQNTEITKTNDIWVKN